MDLNNILKELVMAQEAIEEAISNYYDSNLKDLEDCEFHLGNAIEEIEIKLGIIRKD